MVSYSGLFVHFRFFFCDEIMLVFSHNLPRRNQEDEYIKIRKY